MGLPMPEDKPHWRDDLRTAFGFLTRLPVAAPAGVEPEQIARALRLSPLVGAFIGAMAGSIYWLGLVIGLSPFLAGLLSVLTGILVTGALHEQALSVTADGFAQQLVRARRASILGVLALLFSVLLRGGAVAELSNPGRVFAALIAAGALSRAVMYAVMAVSPNTQAHGIDAVSARPEAEHALTAAVIAIVISLIALPFSMAVPALLSAALSGWLMLMIANRQNSGHSNDATGAVQQVAEISILLVLTALLTL